MDRATYGDYAYCLKCYNKFKSYQKVIPVKVDRKALKIMSTAEARIEMLKKKIEQLEEKVEACKKQDFTGAR